MGSETASLDEASGKWLSGGLKMRSVNLVGLTLPVLGIASVAGGFLLQFTMGTFYSFGNIATYMVSYMRHNGSPNMTYEDFIVVQSTWGMTQGVVMPLSGFLIEFIGPKLAMTSGATIFSLGCGLTYFTINKELWMVAATYGFVAAFGQNIALIPTLTTAMKWFPKRRGTAMGIVVGGFGGGALVFTHIQTAIINPENRSVDPTGPNKGYFTDLELLDRVPHLLLVLATIYFVMGLVGALLINQPPSDWLERKSPEDSDCEDDPTDGVVMSTSSEGMAAPVKKKLHSITWSEALKTKEFYLLWLTRLSIVLITQVVAALYKAFGQTFIYDDHFLAMVGSVSSLFNCSGRLIYGLIMDKSSYKVGMSIEAVILTTLVSTFYLTSQIGQNVLPEQGASTSMASEEACRLLKLQVEAASGNITTISSGLNSTMIGDAEGNHFTTPNSLDNMNALCNNNIVPETFLVTKIVYAIWVWSIFLTFPGAYSMQPAVTCQTFGHRHAGMIYAFLFSADIVNNLMVAVFTKHLKRRVGYLGLFLTISVWGIVALIATLFYPTRPSPKQLENQRNRKEALELDAQT